MVSDGQNFYNTQKYGDKIDDKIDDKIKKKTRIIGTKSPLGMARKIHFNLTHTQLSDKLGLFLCGLRHACFWCVSKKRFNRLYAKIE